MHSVSLCNVSMYVLLSVVLTALSVTRTRANTHARFSKDTCRCSIAANYRVHVKNMFLITGSTHTEYAHKQGTHACACEGMSLGHI